MVGCHVGIYYLAFWLWSLRLRKTVWTHLTYAQGGAAAAGTWQQQQLSPLSGWCAYYYLQKSWRTYLTTYNYILVNLNAIKVCWHRRCAWPNRRLCWSSPTRYRTRRWPCGSGCSAKYRPYGRTLTRQGRGWYPLRQSLHQRTWEHPE